MARKFPKWIDAFLSYTEGIKSPPIFRKWAAISAVSGALQRRSWIRVGKQRLYPNLYILLIAFPGSGKSNAIKLARGVVRKLNGIKLTPARITPRAFYNELQGASDAVLDMTNNSLYCHHSLTAMLDEFSVFVRPGADEFMSDLADLYDCPDPFEYKTAHMGENCFENAFFNFVGGATPKYLKETWTSMTLDQGFPSRIILVYSDEVPKIRLLGETNEIDDEEELVEDKRVIELADDLREISLLRGKFTWQDKARKEFSSWFDSGMAPIPADPRLFHYNQRRLVHIAKLCVVISAAKREDQEVILEDFEEAKETLLFTEVTMAEAVKSLGGNPVKDQMDMAIKFVETECLRGAKGVAEHRIRALLMTDVDPARMRAVMGELISAGHLTASGDEPNRRFYPRRHEPEK